ncbi:MAG TPA: hypothetical protein VJ349_02455, partial [Stellaceae bacterium]|nr:hypothetical protein [Stellaceae bacterium]
MLRMGRKSRRHASAVKPFIRSADGYFLSERAVASPLATAASPLGRKWCVQKEITEGGTHDE